MFLLQRGVGFFRNRVGFLFGRKSFERGDGKMSSIGGFVPSADGRTRGGLPGVSSPIIIIIIIIITSNVKTNTISRFSEER
jgi:hypothetical protein